MKKNWKYWLLATKFFPPVGVNLSNIFRKEEPNPQRKPPFKKEILEERRKELDSKEQIENKNTRIHSSVSACPPILGFSDWRNKMYESKRFIPPPNICFRLCLQFCLYIKKRKESSQVRGSATLREKSVVVG